MDLLYLDIFLLEVASFTVVYVHRPPVVILQRCSDHHVIEAVLVEIRHRCNRSAEAGAAWLILIGATLGVRGAARLIDRLQGGLVLKHPLLERRRGKE